MSNKRPILGTFINYVHADVWPYIGPNTWLAGGAVTRFIEGAEENKGDWDLFSKEPDLVLRQMLDDGWYIQRESSWAWTLEHLKNDQQVQVIKKPYDTPESVINRFDFTVRQFITDGQWLWSGKTSLMDVVDKEIVFHNPDFSDSVTSLAGMIRYANRGYTLTHREARKFLSRWHEMPVLSEAEVSH